MYRVAGHRWMTSTGRWCVNVANTTLPRSRWWPSFYLPLNSWGVPGTPAYNYWFQDLTGSQTFTGGIGKKTSRALIGGISALQLAGVIVKKTARAFSAAPLPFTGTVSKKTSHLMDGSLTFTGGLSRKASKMLDGALVFTGNIFWKLLRAVSAGLTFAGSLSTLYIPGGGGVIRRIRRRISLIQLPEEVAQWLM